MIHEKQQKPSAPAAMAEVNVFIFEQSIRDVNGYAVV